MEPTSRRKGSNVFKSVFQRILSNFPDIGEISADQAIADGVLLRYPCECTSFRGQRQ